jgi:hypothetical protein
VADRVADDAAGRAGGIIIRSLAVALTREEPARQTQR